MDFMKKQQVKLYYAIFAVVLTFFVPLLASAENLQHLKNVFSDLKRLQ